MNLDQEYQRQLEIVKWVDDHFSRSFQVDNKSNMALACFDLAIEHHAAICTLLSSGLYGSLYSLLRVEFEAYGRGLWLSHIATEEDVANFKINDDPGIGFAKLLSVVEEKVGLPSGPLSTLKSNNWDIFCSFTHTGHQALLRRIDEGKTGLVNYGESEVASALRFAGTIALLSAIELANLSKDSDTVSIAIAKAREYVGKGSDQINAVGAPPPLKQT